MKKIISNISFALLPFLLWSQTKDMRDILEQLPIMIAVPSASEYLNAKQLKRLGTKTKQVMAKNGLGGAGGQQFILYPEFDLIDERTADLLTGPVTVVEAEITFTIQQLADGTIFNSEPITVTGNGRSRKYAMTNAINQIRPNNGVLKEFIANAKMRILDYYTEKCDAIINDASMQVNARHYEKAIGMLASIPSEAGCSARARELLLVAWQNYQDQNCSNWLLKAKAAEANNNYSEALHLLAKTDPLSSCANETEFLLKRIGKSVDARDRQLWEALQQRYSDQVALEEMRMEMMESVLTEYYKSQKTELHQLILIRD